MLNFTKSLNKLRAIGRGGKAVVSNGADNAVATSSSTLKNLGKELSSHETIKNPLSTATTKLLKEIVDDVEFVSAKNGIGRTSVVVPMVKSIDRPLDDVIKCLRRGDIDGLVKMYENVANNVPVKEILHGHFVANETRTTFRRIMEATYPDGKLFGTLKRNKTYAKSKLADDALFHKNIDFSHELGGFDKLYRTNKRFRRLIDNLETLPKRAGRKWITVRGAFITVALGGGTIALFRHLTERAKQLAGCWRIYLKSPTGQVASCKITQCSCANRETLAANECTKFLKVSSQLAQICRGFPDPLKDLPKAECRKCDVDAPADSLQYLAVDEMIDPHDVYMCRPRPDVGTLLSEFIADLPEQIWDGVTSAVDVLTTVLTYGGIFILGGIIVFILFKASEWYTWLREKYEMARGRDDNNEEAKHKLVEHVY